MVSAMEECIGDILQLENARVTYITDPTNTVTLIRGSTDSDNGIDFVRGFW